MRYLSDLMVSFTVVFLTGLTGCVVAALAGGCCGSYFFPLWGAVVGALLALPGGFVAGVLGVCLGGRAGWTAAGLIGGGVVDAVLLWGIPQPHDPNAVITAVILAVPCVVGAAVGWLMYEALRPDGRGIPPLFWLKGAIVHSPLTRLPLVSRCGVAVAVLAVGYLRLWPLWQDIWR